MWKLIFLLVAYFVSASWQQLTNTVGAYNPAGSLDTSGINKDALAALAILASSPALMGGATGGAMGGAMGGSFGAGPYGGMPFLAGPKAAFYGGKVPPVFMPVSKKEPAYLTCKNSALPSGQSTPSVVVATVGDYSQEYGAAGGYPSYGPASGAYGPMPGSYGPMAGSYGPMPGAYGPAAGVFGAGGYKGQGYGGGDRTPLSLDITVKAYGVSGAAHVVFTTQAAVATGCYAENLGRIYSPGQQPVKNPYANFLIGFGPPGPVGYGTPQGQGQYPGVVTSITLYPDRPSNAHVDSLPVDDLDDLAGRGIAVVSSVSYDGYGQTVMDGKIIACCSLSYDNRPRDLGVSVAAAGGYPSGSSPPGPSYPTSGPSPSAYPAGAPPPGPTYPQAGPAYPQSGPTYPQSGPAYPQPGPAYPSGK